MNEWLLFTMGLMVVILVCISVLAHTALRRADKVMGMDVNEDYDSEIWRSLLFEKCQIWIRDRERERGTLCPYCNGDGRARLRNEDSAE